MSLRLISGMQCLHVSFVSCCICCLVQVWSSAETQRKEDELRHQALYPWRNQGKGLVRVKRDWIIPPIRVLENSKQVPEDLVQVNFTYSYSVGNCCVRSVVYGA